MTSRVNNFHCIVSLEIRKGISNTWVAKTYSHFYEGIDESVPEIRVKKWAIRDTENYLYNTEDYPVYGKNWKIKEVTLIK